MPIPLWDQSMGSSGFTTGGSPELPDYWPTGTGGCIVLLSLGQAWAPIALRALQCIKTAGGFKENSEGISHPLTLHASHYDPPGTRWHSVVLPRNQTGPPRSPQDRLQCRRPDPPNIFPCANQVPENPGDMCLHTVPPQVSDPHRRSSRMTPVPLHRPPWDSWRIRACRLRRPARPGPYRLLPLFFLRTLRPGKSIISAPTGISLLFGSVTSATASPFETADRQSSISSADEPAFAVSKYSLSLSSSDSTTSFSDIWKRLNNPHDTGGR